MKLCSRLNGFWSKLLRKTTNWVSDPIWGKLGVTHDPGWGLVVSVIFPVWYGKIIQGYSTVDEHCEEKRGENDKTQPCRLICYYFYSVHKLVKNWAWRVEAMPPFASHTNAPGLQSDIIMWPLPTLWTAHMSVSMIGQLWYTWIAAQNGQSSLLRWCLCEGGGCHMLISLSLILALMLWFPRCQISRVSEWVIEYVIFSMG